MPHELEAGLLSALRAFTGILLGLLVFNFIEFIGRPGPDLHPVWNNLAMTVLAALALGYLYLPRLPELLGPRHLLVALALVLAVPFGSQIMDLGEPFSGYRQLAGERLLLLLFPLLIVSWQYRGRTVVVFVLATTAFDLGLTILGYAWPIWFDFEYLWTLVIRAVVLTSSGLLVARLMREQRQQRFALAEANERLAEYAVTLEELAVTRERGRMARELHDTLAHSLSGLAVQLEAVDSLWDADASRARALLTQSLAETRRGLDETRRAICALRAGPLHERGLVTALRELAEDTLRGKQIAVEPDLAAQVPSLGDAIETCVYRVAQESLCNVARHAHATRVTLRLTVEAQTLSLLIEDDGAGFLPDSIDQLRCFGLRGLRERARSVGAALTVGSRPGAGTRVDLKGTLPSAEGAS